MYARNYALEQFNTTIRTQNTCTSKNDVFFFALAKNLVTFLEDYCGFYFQTQTLNLAKM